MRLAFGLMAMLLVTALQTALTENAVKATQPKQQQQQKKKRTQRRGGNPQRAGNGMRITANMPEFMRMQVKDAPQVQHPGCGAQQQRRKQRGTDYPAWAAAPKGHAEMLKKQREEEEAKKPKNMSQAKKLAKKMRAEADELEKNATLTVEALPEETELQAENIIKESIRMSETFPVERKNRLRENAKKRAEDLIATMPQRAIEIRETAKQKADEMRADAEKVLEDAKRDFKDQGPLAALKRLFHRKKGELKKEKEEL